MKYVLLIIVLTVVGCRNKITQPAFYPTPMDSIGYVAYPSDIDSVLEVMRISGVTSTASAEGIGKTLWTNASNANRLYNFVITPKRDTVKVLMLVCDTANYPNSSMLYLRKQDQMLNEVKMAWWQFGYEVKFTNQYGFNNWNEYLDLNKKRLPTSIVVWQTKEINEIPR